MKKFQKENLISEHPIVNEKWSSLKVDENPAWPDYPNEAFPSFFYNRKENSLNYQTHIAETFDR